MSHTYAILVLSPAAFEEIREHLEVAGYADQFHADASGLVIDMHGIAVQAAPHELLAYHCALCGATIHQGRVWQCACEDETISEQDYNAGRSLPPSWTDSLETTA